MSKHTPGPWWVEDLFIFADGVRVADVNPNEDDEIKRSDDQVEADAKLIAALPAMYHACQLALEEYEEMGCEHEPENPYPEVCPCCAVQAAIAEAEGKE